MSEISNTPNVPPTGENIASNTAAYDANPTSRAAIVEQVRAMLDKQPKQAAKATPRALDATPPEAPELAGEDEGEEIEAAPAPAAEEDGDDRISSVVRARMRAQRLRREAEQQKQSIELERMRLDQERREVDRLRKAAETLKADPLAGLRELGLDLREINERVAMDGTPEAQVKALAQALEAQKRELDEYRKGQEQRELQSQIRTAEAEFSRLASDSEQFPYLAARIELHPQAVMRQAYDIQAEVVRRTGKTPTLHEIAEALDYLEAEGYRTIAERQSRRGPQDGRKTGNAPAGSKATNRTLSPSRAAERGGPAKVDLANLPREKQVEYVVSLAKQNALHKILGT